jgi:hypothetical protein
MTSGDRRFDFFISRSGPDKSIAIFIARILTEAGYRVILQDWDFGHKDFVSMMDAALQQSHRVITLLSHAYLRSEFCGAEWRAIFAEDPKNWGQRLLLFRVDKCQPQGLLSLLAYTDLVPVLESESSLREVVLAGVSTRRNPEARQLISSLTRAAGTITYPEIRPVQNFTGRVAELEALDSAFLSTGNAHAPVAVLCGIAGAGKSSLAQEYCWTRREKYSGVWRIDGSNEDALKADLLRLGREFINGIDLSSDSEEAAKIVVSRLFPAFSDRPWLLLFDAIESEPLLNKWLPSSGANVLVTSRLSSWSRDVVTVPTAEFTEKEAIAYLRNEGNRPDITDDGLRELAEKVGYLPLALSHLGGFMRYKRTVTGARILERLESLLEQPPPSNLGSPSVAATFEMAITTAEADAPGCRSVLAFASFFSPKAIPVEVFDRPATMYPNVMQAVASDADLRENALGTLDQLSLIRFHPESQSFDIHVLVQTAATPNDQPRAWWEAARNVLYSLYRRDAKAQTDLTARYISHAYHLDFQSPKYTGDLELRAFAMKGRELYEALSEEEWQKEIADFKQRIAAAVEAHGYASEEVRYELNQLALRCDWRGDQQGHAQAWRSATEIVLKLEGLSERAIRHADCYCDALRKCGLHRWQIAQEVAALGVRVVPFDAEELTDGISVSADLFGMTRDRMVEILATVGDTCPPDPSRFLSLCEVELNNAGASPEMVRELIAYLGRKLGVQQGGALSIPAGTGVLGSDENLYAAINQAMQQAVAEGCSNKEDLFIAIDRALRDAGAEGSSLEYLLDEIASQFMVNRSALRQPSG